jgi:hypothetical protein
MGTTDCYKNVMLLYSKQAWGQILQRLRKRPPNLKAQLAPWQTNEQQSYITKACVPSFILMQLLWCNLNIKNRYPVTIRGSLLCNSETDRGTVSTSDTLIVTTYYNHSTMVWCIRVLKDQKLRVGNLYILCSLLHSIQIISYISFLRRNVRNIQRLTVQTI